MQMDVLPDWQSTQRSWLHLKQAPESAVKEKGRLHVKQEVVLEDEHVAQGSAQRTQVEPEREAGGRHRVQLVAEVSQVAHGGVQRVQLPPLSKKPSWQALQVPPVQFWQPTGHLSHAVPLVLFWKPGWHSAH